MPEWVKKNPPEWDELLRQQAAPRTGLHVTDCIGCPRRRALIAEGAEVDLSRLEARLMGTGVHAQLAQVNPETAEIKVSGTLFGLDVVGSVDRLAPDGYVEDYKAGEDRSNGWLPDGASPEYVWQAETYRYILARMGTPTLGWRIFKRHNRAWYMAEHTGPVWDDAQLAKFRPHDGAFTAKEIAWQAQSLCGVAELPLVGATQKMGKQTICQWCEVEGPCGEAGAEMEL